jgi:peptide/nickel transport system permease protein
MRKMRTLLKLNGRLKAGLILLLIFAILGLVLPRFSPYSAIDWNVVPRNLPASKIHIFGTTSLGQDTFWLLTFAIQNSLFIGIIVAFFSTAIGVLAGLTAGYAGGITDRILSLLMDVFIAVPSLPILILVASLLQGKTSLLTIGIVLIIFNWPWPARQIRAIALSMREREFINTARFSGKGTLGIVVYEIFPYVLNWSVANFVNTVLVAISIESGLAVIGLSSVQQATLGTMIYWALQYQAILGKRWWWIGAPVVAIVILFIALFLASTGYAEYSAEKRGRQSA